MRIRKNVKNLGSDEKANFVNAVLTLKNRSSVLHPDDSTMDRYDDYVAIHLNSMMLSMTNPAVDPNWYPGWAHNGRSIIIIIFSIVGFTGMGLSFFGSILGIIGGMLAFSKR